jgi:DUF1680 family protein
VYVRIPGWTSWAKASVNGAPAPAQPGEYLALKHRWQAGDRIRLELDMRPRLTAANPLVAENLGRVAVERGPLVYCLEQLDQKDLPSVFDATLIPAAGFQEEVKADLPGGVVALRHKGAAFRRPLGEEPLYQPLSSAAARATRPAELVLIPYYAWHNRGAGQMQVWIPTAGTQRRPRKPAE